MELDRREVWDGKNRTPISMLLRDVIRKPNPENTQKVAESIYGRLDPAPLILIGEEVAERMMEGGNLLYIWPHYSFWDIPLVNAALQFAPDQPQTKNIVANMPRPFFPAGSIPVEFYWDDIKRGLESDLSENKIAAYGNLLLSMFLGGGAFRSDEFKHARNQAMINSAVEEILLGHTELALPVSLREGLTRFFTKRLTRQKLEFPESPEIELPEDIDVSALGKGNVALWPSGPNMIGQVRSGGARIIKKIQDFGIEPNIINVHLYTDPRLIFSGIMGRSEHPIVMAALPGPSNGELRTLLDYSNEDPLEIKMQRAKQTTRYLADVFKGQLPEVLNAMQKHLAPSSFEYHAQQAERVYPRI